MLDILYPRNGAVLNHNHGVETAEALEIEVRGICGAGGTVFVNGNEADFDGQGFSAKVKLREKFNTIRAEFEDGTGKSIREIQVLWDKASFKRYNFFIDDHSFVFTEIARQRPAHLLEHFYLKFLHEMHLRYGTFFTLNCFYRNDHDKDHFTLAQFPDCYKSEWEDNSDWLKLAFHAYSEFPDRTYQNSTAETLGRDYDLVLGELARFAGEKSIVPMVALHWGMARPEAIKALTDRGVTALEGQFINPRAGIEDAGSREYVCDVGYFVNLDEARYIEKQGILHDFRHNVTYFKGDCTANLWTCQQIEEKIAIAKQSKKDFISMASHEQYSFPHYFNYLPDHFQRIETAIRLATEAGYKPSLFTDGFLGNVSWGK
ncbi:MAG: hypothetical protein IKS20_14595 [Victivallales bacterium]|nr:hypothetical protein [Victivallales bacterium]